MLPVAPEPQHRILEARELSCNMDRPLHAIETEGRIVDARHIETAVALPVGRQVRVLVLLSAIEEDVSESEWLATAARNPVFEFLADAAEDIYTLEDGEPFVRA